MRRWLRNLVIAVLAALLLAGGVGAMVRAQDGDDPAAEEDDDLLLFSADPAFPVLFQALAPGDVAESSRFQAQITLGAEDRAETPLVYVALENTGWSQGAIGVISDRLDANADYVALEVRDRGMAGYAVREDGQGLVVSLAYDPEIGPDGEPSFRFDMVIGAMRAFRIFRVADEGLTLFAQQNTLVNDARVQERTIVTVDPEPVFGDLVLEVHIEARPAPDNTPEAVPLADADGDGVPDADDACPQEWGTLPNGCRAGGGDQ